MYTAKYVDELNPTPNAPMSMYVEARAKEKNLAVLEMELTYILTYILVRQAKAAPK